ncbi:MAG: hypothetical protein HUJ69_05695 [Lachnospiraceae bacterium]|nr:hypothetical protein [Lachnospiraceae bacterium]
MRRYFAIIVLLLVLSLITACNSQVMSDNGMLSAEDTKHLQFYYRTSGDVDELLHFLNLRFNESYDSNTPYQVLNADTLRIISGMEYKQVVNIVEGKLDSLYFYFDETYDEQAAAHLLSLMDSLSESYGDPITYPGIEDRILPNMQNLDPGQTYVEIWDAGNGVDCKVNLELFGEEENRVILLRIIYVPHK